MLSDNIRRYFLPSYLSLCLLNGLLTVLAQVLQVGSCWARIVVYLGKELYLDMIRYYFVVRIMLIVSSTPFFSYNSMVRGHQ